MINLNPANNVYLYNHFLINYNDFSPSLGEAQFEVKINYINPVSKGTSSMSANPYKQGSR